MSGIIYGLCALTALGCALLLLRSYLDSKSRLLLWSCLCFVGLFLNNLLLVFDRVIFPYSIDLSTIRLIPGLIVTVTLLGMIAMASLVAGVHFLKFWRSSRDRFFLYFAIAFWIEGVNRFLLALMNPLPEEFPIFYVIRIFAFGVILFAIFDKNWPKKR
jgi:hypothetical protein